MQGNAVFRDRWMLAAGKVEKEVADLARWKGLGGRKPGKVPGLKIDLARLEALALTESGFASAEITRGCACTDRKWLRKCGNDPGMYLE